jgi:hypothetical protein
MAPRARSLGCGSPDLALGARGVTLRDLSGIFNRYFLAGFFLPAFGALAIELLVTGRDVAPKGKGDPALLSHVAVLVLFGLLGGLVLLGLRRPVVRLFEGYPLQSLRARFARDSRFDLPDWARPTSYADRVYTWRVGRQRARREQLLTDRTDQGRRELDRQFGSEHLTLLPTRFGNILRAFEHHADSRWGLRGLTVWPRIAALLTDREREYHVDAETNVMFFLNVCVLSVVVGAVLTALGHPVGAAGLLLAWASYRLTLVAAISWGVEVRASIDLHRLELYERLGVRRPTSFSDERRTGAFVGRCLEFGDRIPDRLWGPGTWSD